VKERHSHRPGYYTHDVRQRAHAVIGVVALAVLPGAAPLARQASSAAEFPPLGDREFWELTTTVSEPGGNADTENLVSNEVGYLRVFPELASRPPGGVYLGVGPEQNFTYIANLRPDVAFIVDIRRGNRDLHLLYRALFELAPDRVEFVALLFSRPPPRGLSTSSTAAQIFAAFDSAKKSERDFRANVARLTAWLRARPWPLSDDEWRGIETAYQQFFDFGPRITAGSPHAGGPVSMAAMLRRPADAYSALMEATDERGEARSFLSTEARFQAVRALQRKNLVVPVVGDFAGPKALRGVGGWLRARGATVSTFYLSNVEDYLRMNGTWNAFCRNVASLPVDARSQFISASAGGTRPRVGASWTRSIESLIQPCR
jgi:hypothetical protein